MTTASQTPHRPRPRAWQPTEVTRLIQVVAWVILAAQSFIMVTGALVRLTGSGLGCPDWPTCDGRSITNTPEMGIHGYIEFGNRVLGVVLAVICIAAVIILFRLRKQRRDLFVMSLLLFLVVPFQAVLGGITVHMQLNPWIVAGHFLPSAAAVALSAYFVRRTHDAGGAPESRAPGTLRLLAWITGGLVVITVLLGVLTTGAGPHAGDEISARNGFPVELMTRLHAAPVWLLVVVTVALLVQATRLKQPRVRAAAIALLVVEILQGVIGYTQFFTGLPVWLVAAHMLGMCLVLTAAVFTVDSAYTRAPLTSAGLPSSDQPSVAHSAVSRA